MYLVKIYSLSLLPVVITDLVEVWGLIYKISYDLSYDYRKFIVRSTYDSDLNMLKFNFSQEYRKLIYEHYLRRYYDFARECYLWKAFHSLWDVL